MIPMPVLIAILLAWIVLTRWRASRWTGEGGG